MAQNSNVCILLPVKVIVSIIVLYFNLTKKSNLIGNYELFIFGEKAYFFVSLCIQGGSKIVSHLQLIVNQ